MQVTNLQQIHRSPLFNPYVAIGGGVFYPPDALFILLLGNRFELWQMLLWLFLNICGLKNAEKKFADISTSISNMAARKWTSN